MWPNYDRTTYWGSYCFEIFSNAFCDAFEELVFFQKVGRNYSLVLLRIQYKSLQYSIYLGFPSTTTTTGKGRTCLKENHVQIIVPFTCLFFYQSPFQEYPVIWTSTLSFHFSNLKILKCVYDIFYLALLWILMDTRGPSTTYNIKVGDNFKFVL